MKWRLRRQENPGGEWSVLDPRLDYRIYCYNHEHHRGTHVHHPSEGQAGAILDLGSAAEADAVMRRYHAKYDSFKLDNLKQEVKTWKSGSSGK